MIKLDGVSEQTEQGLKPCPFCGGEASYKTPMRILTEGIMVIECNDCGACPYVVAVNEGDDETDKKNALTEKWNRRADND